MTEDQTQPERGKSQFWLDMIEDAQRSLQAWQDASDNIDKTYASLEQLRNGGRDREFQLFWSNIQVMGPSIYARPPVPVVTPKFKDRRPLYRTASEVLERCCLISFDMADIDQHMIAMRDDLAIVGRGAAWVRYESDSDGERVCYEQVDRKDFLHEPARKWSEVDWVACRAWLTRDEMCERFKDAADDVQYETRRDEAKNGSMSSVEKCGVWEIWCKSEDKVIWVTEGCQEILEESKPHLKLTNFFPCPKPAYATVQRRSLIPVPDMLFYKDQLEEVNALTRRIHALADAIKVRGFYSGSGDIGEAIERAINLTDDTQVLVPVPAMAALMQGGGEPIVWLPLEMVASTITGLIELRRQVIDDVYQIIGLSDIMRGSTVASETLGAQQLKQQNGSYRVRDKQNELVRVARDLVRIGAEIMANEFSRETLEDMAQMDLPTDADVAEQVAQIKESGRAEVEGLLEKAQEMAQQAQQQGQQIDPAQAQQQFEQQQQQVIAKWKAELDKAQKTVTIDQVMEFLADEKLRPFALDIETDSTIYPDEMAEKQSRQEFMQAFSSTMSGLMPMFQLGPEAVAVAGGLAKFALSPYRVGRELEGLIDDFADQGPQMAQRMHEANNKGESADMAAANMKLAEAETMKAQASMEGVKAKAANDQAALQGKLQEMQLKAAKDQQDGQLKIGKLQSDAQKQQQDFAAKMAKTDAEVDKIRAETAAILQSIGLDARKQDLEEYRAQDASQARQVDQTMSAQVQQRAAQDSDRNHERAERGEDRADMQAQQEPFND